MGDQRERVLAAANKIRTEGVSPEVAPLVADLLEKHRDMQIGPDGWQKGWIAVDHAQVVLADAVLDQ